MSSDTRIPESIFAWPPIRAILETDFTFYTIKEVVGLAGLDLTRLGHLHQQAGGGASKGGLMSAIDSELAKLDQTGLRRFLVLVAEEVLRRRPASAEGLAGLLERHGWTITEGTLVPVEVLDAADLPELSPSAHHDFAKAAARFRDGDASGAISSACGAVDSVTSGVYEENNLGEPGDASFQERVKVSLRHLRSLPALQEDLEQLGWSPRDARLLANNLEGAINQMAFVMQSLRSRMGDVHGTRPSLRVLVFSAIKLSQILVRLLSRS